MPAAEARRNSNRSAGSNKRGRRLKSTPAPRFLGRELPAQIISFDVIFAPAPPWPALLNTLLLPLKFVRCCLLRRCLGSDLFAFACLQLRFMSCGLLACCQHASKIYDTGTGTGDWTSKQGKSCAPRNDAKHGKRSASAPAATSSRTQGLWASGFTLGLVFSRSNLARAGNNHTSRRRDLRTQQASRTRSVDINPQNPHSMGAPTRRGSARAKEEQTSRADGIPPTVGDSARRSF